MGSCEVREGRRIVARLPYGGDLLTEILAVAKEYGIALGQVWAIGAVQRARIAFYDQQLHTYRELELDEHLEIVSLIGNISRRDGQPALHAHAAFADGLGGTCGGHLVPGCVIFACELYLTELTGHALERSHDEVTGLPLWRDL
jgi:predicted DNA-binding protein with PD1-like motif